MFLPLHDSAPLRVIRFQLVTGLLIGGGGANPAFLRRHTGGADRPGAAGRGPAGDSGAAYARHLHVSARRLAASDRQHGLPVGLRRQCGRRFRSCRVRAVLPCLRHCCGAGPCGHERLLAGAADRRIRSGGRRAGGLLAAVSAVAGAGAAVHAHSPQALRAVGAGRLVRLPGDLGSGSHAGEGGRGLVGAHRRFRGRPRPHAAAAPLPAAQACRRDAAP